MASPNFSFSRGGKPGWQNVVGESACLFHPPNCALSGFFSHSPSPLRVPPATFAFEQDDSDLPDSSRTTTDISMTRLPSFGVPPHETTRHYSASLGSSNNLDNQPVPVSPESPGELPATASGGLLGDHHLATGATTTIASKGNTTVEPPAWARPWIQCRSIPSRSYQMGSTFSRKEAGGSSIPAAAFSSSGSVEASSEERIMLSDLQLLSNVSTAATMTPVLPEEQNGRAGEEEPQQQLVEDQASSQHQKRHVPPSRRAIFHRTLTRSGDGVWTLQPPLGLECEGRSTAWERRKPPSPHPILAMALSLGATDCTESWQSIAGRIRYVRTAELRKKAQAKTGPWKKLFGCFKF